MLTRAVSDNDEDTKSTSKILDSLGLTGSSRASRGTTVAHTEGLGKGNVTSLSESSDTKTLLSSKEFVLIGEIDISDLNDGVSIFTILSFPVETRVLGPIEIGNIANKVAKDPLVDSPEEILLINLDSDKSLNLGTDELVRKVSTAHIGQVLHHTVNFEVLLLEHLCSLSGALKAFSDLLGEDHLETKKGNLRLVLVDEFNKAHAEALSGSVLANVTHRILHATLKSAKPIFNVAFTLDVFVQFDGLSSTTPVLVDSNDKSLVDLVESDSADGIEHLFEIILNLAWVSTNGQDLKEIRVGSEVETGEYASLLFKVSLELTLAVLKVLLHLGESRGEQIVLAAWNNKFLLSDTLHDLLPLSIGALEDLGLLRHLFGDLTTSEDENETHPLGHDLEPLL